MKTTPPPASRGHFRALAWLALATAIALPAPLNAASLDFGDAPDGVDASYPAAPGQPGVTAAFPTLLASNGARHATIGEEWLGKADSAPDAEGEAKVVNNDSYDSAFPPIPFFLTLTSLPPTAAVSFWVTIPAGVPDVYRYVNMLIDWDRSGDWRNVPGAAPEWAIVNRVIDMRPGNTQLITVPIAWGLGAQLAPQIFWVRLTLTRTMLDPAAYGPDGWDGSGSFTHGETEDFLFHPNKKHSDPGVPPPGPVPGWSGGGPSIKCVPKYQSVAHGTPAKINVMLVNPADPPPTSSTWKTWEPTESPKLAFGATWPDPPAPGGTTTTAGAGTLIGTITANSIVDPRFFNPEQREYKATARWDGYTQDSCHAYVDIWHSSWWGPFGMYSHYNMLKDDLATTPTSPPDYQDDLVLFCQNSLFPYTTGDYTGARAGLDFLRSEIDAHVPDLADRVRLHGQINDLDAVMPPNGAPPEPVPVLVAPACGDTVSGVLPLIAETNTPGVTRALFEVYSDGVWTLISEDFVGGDGWSAPWDTTTLADGHARLRVTMLRSDPPEPETHGTFEATVLVENSAPIPIPDSPPPGSTQAGIVLVRALADTPDDSTCTFSIARPDGAWFTFGTDTDPKDGFAAPLDTGQQWEGPVMLRATVTDELGNMQESLWSMIVAPSFMAWRVQYGLIAEGIPGADADSDPDNDGVPLGAEYYLQMSPSLPEAIADHVHWEQVAGPDFQLRFRPNPWTDGLRCRVESSANLELWDILATDPVPDPTGQVVIPVPTLPRRFVQLNLTEERP